LTATLTENRAEKRTVCEFRKLLSSELDSGYAVLIEAYGWLNARGSGQWPHRFPYEKYRKWHKLGLNYGFFSNEKLTTVLSLVEEADDRWRDYLSGACVIWVRAVAGSSRHQKKGFGRLAIQAAVHRIVMEQGRPLFLHCFKGSGFLPDYYGCLGFKALSETELENGSWVLMKHPVPSGKI
jgi:hypothetical protein